MVRRARKRAIWVNIPFGGMNFTESSGNQPLLLPEDWEAQFTGLANERAVLRAIVGEIVFTQTVVGTLGGNFFWGIYVRDATSTNVPVFTTTGMSQVDWLRVGARATTNSVSSSNTSASMLNSYQVEIKAKRKLDARSEICLTAQYAADAAAPAAVASGILRFLIARD